MLQLSSSSQVPWSELKSSVMTCTVLLWVFFGVKLVNLLCHTTTIDEEVSEVAAAKQRWMNFCISKLVHETASRQCPWSAWVLPVPTTHSRLFANILLRPAYTKYNWNLARAQTAQVMSGSRAIVNWLTTELSGGGSPARFYSGLISVKLKCPHAFHVIWLPQQLSFLACM